MTNYIEQMMEAAGVGFISQCKHGDDFPQNCDCDYSCEECSAQIKKYPDFTPAKQLELIKLINKKHRNIRLCWLQSDGTYGVQVNPVVRAFGMYYESESFEDLIAIVTFELLKANELDKAEVRRILEE